jgi:2-phospho-L-lactate guanylyltransferase
VHAPSGWAAVVPLKQPASAKQRLAGLDAWRPALAVAFATDVVTALLASQAVREIVVVGGDGLAPALLDLPAVHRIADVRGLNDAVEAGMARAHPLTATGVLVLPADLPCLRPADVDVLLDGAPPHRAQVLADADGLGTSALVIPAGVTFVPRFGPGSYARHLAAGAMPVEGDLATARRDVDTVEHLETARRLGVGLETARLLAQLDADSGALPAVSG